MIGFCRNIIFILIVVFFSSLKIFSQSLELVIDYSDTVFMSPGEDFFRFEVKLINHSTDSMFLPGYKVNFVDYPSFHDIRIYNSEVNKYDGLRNKFSSDELFLNMIGCSNQLIMCIVDTQSDSLVGQDNESFCWRIPYFEIESFDEYQNFQQYQQDTLDPTGLLLKEKMLVIPPGNSFEKVFSFDFKCLKFAQGHTYRLFVCYSITRMCASNLIGSWILNKHLPDLPIKSNNLLLKSIN
jgi:hypothetical protein